MSKSTLVPGSGAKDERAVPDAKADERIVDALAVAAAASGGMGEDVCERVVVEEDVEQLQVRPLHLGNHLLGSRTGFVQSCPC